MSNIITWKVKTNLDEKLVPLAGKVFDSKDLAVDAFSDAANSLANLGEYVTLYRIKKTGFGESYYDPYRTWIVGNNGEIIKVHSAAPKTVERALLRREKERALAKFGPIVKDLRNLDKVLRDLDPIVTYMAGGYVEVPMQKGEDADLKMIKSQKILSGKDRLEYLKRVNEWDLQSMKRKLQYYNDIADKGRPEVERLEKLGLIKVIPLGNVPKFGEAVIVRGWFPGPRVRDFFSEDVVWDRRKKSDE